MTSDSSDDDRYMHDLARELLDKHEIIRTTTSVGTGNASADNARDLLETLMLAVMTTRHVIVWHFGSEPSPAETVRFEHEFPEWKLIDSVCSGRTRPFPSCEPGDPETSLDVPIDQLCRRFLAAYEHRHLGEAARQEPQATPVPRQAPRTGRAFGTKRH